MMEPERLDGALVAQGSVRDYFHDSLTCALRNQKLRADQHTVHYVVSLLTTYARSEDFFERNADGFSLQPLATLYADAVAASTPEQRRCSLRRLGDVALFISGLFSDSLNRRVVDVDYYIAMGGSAYGYLSGSMRGTLSGAALSGIFGELSSKFQAFVDVLAEVSERAHLTSDSDIMRLYEVWLRTGSKRVAVKLRRLGIEPAAGSSTHYEH